jgi:hypothetical protein
MKELQGAASAQVSASVGECFALVEAIEEYPSWYPEKVKHVYVVERSHDGRPLAARAQLHAAYGPLARDFDLLLAVAAEPLDHVKLTRVPHDSYDPERFEVMWKIRPGRIDLELRANLSMPRLLPVGGIGVDMAQGFVGAAVRALSRSR